MCVYFIGETFESLKYIYRISSQAIGKIVPETCQAIIDTPETYLKVRNFNFIKQNHQKKTN